MVNRQWVVLGVTKFDSVVFIAYYRIIGVVLYHAPFLTNLYFFFTKQPNR